MCLQTPFAPDDRCTNTGYSTFSTGLLLFILGFSGFCLRGFQAVFIAENAGVCSVFLFFSNVLQIFFNLAFITERVQVIYGMNKGSLFNQNADFGCRIRTNTPLYKT